MSGFLCGCWDSHSDLHVVQQAHHWLHHLSRLHKFIHSDFSLCLNRNVRVSSPSCSHPTAAPFIAEASERKPFGQCRGVLDARDLHNFHPRQNTFHLTSPMFCSVPFLPYTPSVCFFWTLSECSTYNSITTHYLPEWLCLEEKKFSRILLPQCTTVLDFIHCHSFVTPVEVSLQLQHSKWNTCSLDTTL